MGHDTYISRNNRKGEPEMPNFTDYARNSVGQLKHTVSVERTPQGWTLSLKASPVQPVMPSADLPSAEFFAAIAAQSKVVATREVPPQYVGTIEVRPAVAAQDLVYEVLGTAWSVEDKGRGFLVQIR